MWARMLRAAVLDPTVFREVERDETAVLQALAVVAIAGMAIGLGSSAAGFGPSGGARLLFLLFVAAVVLFTWTVWAFLTYFVGTRLFRSRATYRGVLRSLGFAHSPGVLGVLVFLPAIGPILFGLVSIWILVAGVVGARQAMDFGTWPALGSTLAGWLIALALRGFLLGV